MATVPPATLRSTARPGGPKESLALPHPVSARATRDRHHRDRDPRAGSDQHDREQGQQRAEREGSHRRERRAPRVRDVVGVDAQLGLGVRAERVVLGELLGDLEGEVLGQSLRHVDAGQLLQLVRRVVAELAAFLLQERQLGVALGADRDVLPGRHAQCARRQAGDAGDEDRGPVGASRPRRPPRSRRSTRCRRWRPARRHAASSAGRGRPASCGSSSWGPACRRVQGISRPDIS